MRPLRILVLAHEDLLPPDSMEGFSDEEILEWKTEFDVLTTLQNIGHDAQIIGVRDDLGVIGDKLADFKPHITFNLLEEFHSVPTFDSYVVSYLILKQQKFTGCNPRGLMLAHDKALTKQILTYHRLPTPKFFVIPAGKKSRKPARLTYPLFIKSATEEASLGLSQSNIVYNDEELQQQVADIHQVTESDALCEEYIEGRELYVGIIGNTRLTSFKIWELRFDRNKEKIPLIATREAKWDPKFQKKYGVMTYPAEDLSPEIEQKILQTCKRVYRALFLTGYARIDLRLTADGRIFVLEANPNPNLSYGEDFAESGDARGIPYEDLLNRIVKLGLRYSAVKSV
ncbi:MAG: ATP-grasp domain-containing protein [Planctomycetaceae bacterium]